MRTTFDTLKQQIEDITEYTSAEEIDDLYGDIEKALDEGDIDYMEYEELVTLISEV